MVGSGSYKACGIAWQATSTDVCLCMCHCKHLSYILLLGNDIGINAPLKHLLQGMTDPLDTAGACAGLFASRSPRPPMKVTRRRQADVPQTALVV